MAAAHVHRRLYTFTATQASLTVELSNASLLPDERMVADAVRVVEARPTTSYTYDPLGNPATTTDPLGNTTETVYCPLGVRLFEEYGPDPDGAGPLPAPATLYGFDRALNLTAVTAPGGAVSEYTYDELRRPTSTRAGQIVRPGHGELYRIPRARRAGAWTNVATGGFGDNHRTHATVTGSTPTATVHCDLPGPRRR